ncbi:hypothetical protein RIF29_17567 [Crotalaria pallida]|uniref:Uncharacterized protein n=1 Tax=Crotalaria pallida TaxID=3830 RepID=A0AAN9ID33_CROPI
MISLSSVSYGRPCPLNYKVVVGKFPIFYRCLKGETISLTAKLFLAYQHILEHQQRQFEAVRLCLVNVLYRLSIVGKKAGRLFLTNVLYFITFVAQRKERETSIENT